MAKILIIDDEAPMRRLVGEFLRLAGHETVVATNGLEGMKLAKETQFDLVLTDIIMPEKEGIEVIMDLRCQQPGLRIIAMSSGGRLNADDCLKIAQKLGAKATLAKPASARCVIPMIRHNHLQYSRLRRIQEAKPRCFSVPHTSRRPKRQVLTSLEASGIQEPRQFTSLEASRQTIP